MTVKIPIVENQEMPLKLSTTLGLWLVLRATSSTTESGSTSVGSSGRGKDVQDGGRPLPPLAGVWSRALMRVVTTPALRGRVAYCPALSATIWSRPKHTEEAAPSDKDFSEGTFSQELLARWNNHQKGVLGTYLTTGQKPKDVQNSP